MPTVYKYDDNYLSTDFETDSAFETSNEKYDYLFENMKKFNGDCPYGFYQVPMHYSCCLV